MGQVSILTENQKIILGKVKEDKWLNNRFYLTGGTALSAFYLQHRYSDDLDFFSSEKFENEIVFSKVQKWSKEIGFTFQSRFVEVVYRFEIAFADKNSLLVDFGHYPYKSCDAVSDFQGTKIDSLLDIAVNKMLLVSQRTEVKDFVDLFFLLDKFSTGDLVSGVKEKFKVEIDPLLLAADFLKVEDFDFLPRMIRQLSLADLKNAFREQAKRLGHTKVE